MAPVGGLVLTFMFDRYGRKKTFYFILIVSIAGWSVIATVWNPTSMFVQLLIGRALNGISHGMATGASAVYLSEIAYANLRGRIFIIQTIITTIGILIIYVMGYFMPVKLKRLSSLQSATFIPFDFRTDLLEIFGRCSSPFGSSINAGHGVPKRITTLVDLQESP